MAPLVMANLNNYFWSPCSSDEIDTIVSSLYCMNDNPYQLKWQELSHPLGENWDLNEQCRKDFGDGFKLCSRLTHNFNPCEHLWCSTPENRYLCKTKRAPPLPGSECARGMWCYESNCIVADPDDEIWKLKSDKDTLTMLDGQWSSWSSWSKCSTTCGRGLKSRFRTCDNPAPSLGGRDCDGDMFELRICDLPEQMKLVCRMFSDLSYSVRRSCMKHKVYYRSCKREIDDSRAAQCTDYNKSGRTYVPFQPDNSDEHCLLNCKTTEHGTRLYGEIEALDGTFCSYDDRFSMCYSGKCIPVGCDGKLYSAALEDQCGTCQGDGTNCTLRQQFFNEKLQRGEHNLVRLFPGTRELKLRKPSDVFGIALVNLRTNKTLLAGDGTDQTSAFVDDGLLWRYSNGRTQLLETTGPLLSAYDLKIKSPYSGMRASLNIRFTEPLHIVRTSDEQLEIENNELPEYKPGLNQPVLAMPSVVTTPKPQPRYKWRTVDWTECSKTCGDGEQVSIVECVSIRTNLTVNIALCGHFERIDTEIRRCNTKACQREYRWLMTEWSECSPSDCDNRTPRQRQRYALCVVHPVKSIQDLEQVDESFCSDMRTPPLTEDCKDDTECEIDGFWRTGRWSECLVSCGPGIQQREVTCEKVNIELDGKPKCFDLIKPSEQEECMLIPCGSLPTSTTFSPTLPSRINHTTTANTMIPTTGSNDLTESLVITEGSGFESDPNDVQPLEIPDMESITSPDMFHHTSEMTSFSTNRDSVTDTNVTMDSQSREVTNTPHEIIATRITAETTVSKLETTTTNTPRSKESQLVETTIGANSASSTREFATRLYDDRIMAKRKTMLNNVTDSTKITRLPKSYFSTSSSQQERETSSAVSISSSTTVATTSTGSSSTQATDSSTLTYPINPRLTEKTFAGTEKYSTTRASAPAESVSTTTPKSRMVNFTEKTTVRWLWTRKPSSNLKELNIRKTSTSKPATAAIACNADKSPLCELMTVGKCRLLLFKKLCCVTCRKFN